MRFFRASARCRFEDGPCVTFKQRLLGCGRVSNRAAGGGALRACFAALPQRHIAEDPAAPHATGGSRRFMCRSMRQAAPAPADTAAAARWGGVAPHSRPCPRWPVAPQDSRRSAASPHDSDVYTKCAAPAPQAPDALARSPVVAPLRRGGHPPAPASPFPAARGLRWPRDCVLPTAAACGADQAAFAAAAPGRPQACGPRLSTLGVVPRRKRVRSTGWRLHRPRRHHARLPALGSYKVVGWPPPRQEELRHGGSCPAKTLKAIPPSAHR